MLTWRAPGSRYLRYLRSQSNSAILSIFLKLHNYVRSKYILIIYKFECNWNSSFVFINKFHELFAQPSYLYVNGSGSITSVGEERANLSAVVYL